MRYSSLSYRTIAVRELIKRIPDNYPEVIHGCCYALASLCSSHSVFDDTVLEIMKTTLPLFNTIYGIPEMYKSIVADAVCYLLWACVRQYTAVLSPILDEVLFTLILTCLTSDDLNIRRASAAVLQEFVGRLGNENVDHGLELVNLLSFNSLSQYYTTYTNSSLRNLQNDRASAEGYSLLEVSAGYSESAGNLSPV